MRLICLRTSRGDKTACTVAGLSPFACDSASFRDYLYTAFQQFGNAGLFNLFFGSVAL